MIFQSRIGTDITLTGAMRRIASVEPLTATLMAEAAAIIAAVPCK